MSSDPNPTVLMHQAAAGDAAAANALLPLIYSQLRAAAQNHLNSERPNHTLQATALVHEAYIRLAGPRDIPWENRAHFYAAAAQAMRRILLDHAKSKNRQKRAGHQKHLPLDAATLAARESEDSPDFIALDQSMCRLEEKDPRMAEVVRLKFYAGLEIAQVARVLGVSERTVKNDWAFAKAWLERDLRDHADQP